MNDRPVSLGVIMHAVRRDIKDAIEGIRARSGLPPYVIGAVLDGIRAEIASEELTELLNATTKGVNADDNANEQN